MGKHVTPESLPRLLNDNDSLYQKISLRSLSSAHTTRTQYVLSSTKPRSFPLRTNSERRFHLFHSRCSKSNDEFELKPGAHPPHIEKKILAKMKILALEKSNQGQWLDAYLILSKVLHCSQNHSMVCEKTQSEYANTLYQIGVCLEMLGQQEDALI